MAVKARKKKSLPKKILAVFLDIIMILIFLFSVIFIFTVINSKRNGGDLDIGNYRIFNVVSGSMEDAIPVGSMIITKKQKATDLSVDDVITFKKNSMIITHRIKDIYTQANGEKIITTKGDANKQADTDPVFQRNIIGKVVRSVPYVGHVLIFLRSKLGLIFVITPLFIILIVQIISITKNLYVSIFKKEKAVSPHAPNS